MSAVLMLRGLLSGWGPVGCLHGAQLRSMPTITCLASRTISTGSCVQSASASAAQQQQDTAPHLSSQASDADGPPGPAPDPKPDLVEQFLSPINMSSSEKLLLEKQQLIQSIQRHASDVGSPEVSIGIWTQWIRSRVAASYLHTKNHMSLRQLEMLMHKRRRLLCYLRETNFPAYSACIQKLGLADVFGQTMSADRYPIGKAHGDSAGSRDHIKRQRFAFHRAYKKKSTSQWKRLLPQLQFQDPQLPPPPKTMISGSVQRL